VLQLFFNGGSIYVWSLSCNDGNLLHGNSFNPFECIPLTLNEMCSKPPSSKYWRAQASNDVKIMAQVYSEQRNRKERGVFLFYFISFSCMVSAEYSKLLSCSVLGSPLGFGPIYRQQVKASLKFFF
jgi:hypothetical protein